MGIFSVWRHHLQNSANRQAITDARQRAIERGSFIIADQQKTASMTQEERAVELESAATMYENRGDNATAATCRKAADVVRRMTAEQYAEHVQARLRYDPAASAAALARRTDVG